MSYASVKGTSVTTLVQSVAMINPIITSDLNSDNTNATVFLTNVNHVYHVYFINGSIYLNN